MNCRFIYIYTYIYMLFCNTDTCTREPKIWRLYPFRGVALDISAQARGKTKRRPNFFVCNVGPSSQNCDSEMSFFSAKQLLMTFGLCVCQGQILESCLPDMQSGDMDISGSMDTGKMFISCDSFSVQSILPRQHFAVFHPLCSLAVCLRHTMNTLVDVARSGFNSTGNQLLPGIQWLHVEVWDEFHEPKLPGLCANAPWTKLRGTLPYLSICLFLQISVFVWFLCW